MRVGFPRVIDTLVLHADVIAQHCLRCLRDEVNGQAAHSPLLEGSDQSLSRYRLSGPALGRREISVRRRFHGEELSSHRGAFFVVSTCWHKAALSKSLASSSEELEAQRG